MTLINKTCEKSHKRKLRKNGVSPPKTFTTKWGVEIEITTHAEQRALQRFVEISEIDFFSFSPQDKGKDGLRLYLDKYGNGILVLEQVFGNTDKRVVITALSPKQVKTGFGFHRMMPKPKYKQPLSQFNQKEENKTLSTEVNWLLQAIETDPFKLAEDYVWMIRMSISEIQDYLFQLKLSKLIWIDSKGRIAPCRNQKGDF